MNTRSAILATIGVAVVALVVGVALGSIAFPLTKTEITTTTKLSTVTTTIPMTTSSNSGISTVCEFGAEGILIFTLQNSSNGNPLGSVPIQVTEVAPLCGSTSYTTTTMSPLSTNASGIIIICCDTAKYYFALSYSGLNYYVNASIGIQIATCVTLGIPSGKVNITTSHQYVC